MSFGGPGGRRRLHRRRPAFSLLETILVVVLLATSASIGLTQFRSVPLAERTTAELAEAVAMQIRSARSVAMHQAVPTETVTVTIQQSRDARSAASIVTRRSTDLRTTIEQTPLPESVVIDQTTPTIGFDPAGSLVTFGRRASSPARWRFRSSDPNSPWHTITVGAITPSVRVEP